MEKTDIKKSKRTLSILEIAATDKENLNSKINRKKVNSNVPRSSFAKKNKKDVELSNKKVTNIKNKINNKSETQQSTISSTDLTIDNPSEDYWKNLAESRKKALDIALKENVDLHNKINELEYENSCLKKMLDEAKVLVEVFTEMLKEKPDDSSTTNKSDNTLDENKDGVTSDSDTEEMSFQSCV